MNDARQHDPERHDVEHRPARIPAAAEDRETDRAAAAFARLVEVMDRLRAPGGCPWDGEQTHASLVRYLIEETYEVLEAIEAPGGTDLALLREELGDVLLQVVFHARIAQETPPGEGGFGTAEVVEGLVEKLVRRHPHVFGLEGPGAETADLEALTRSWDELKKREKPERTGPFDGIPPALPALALAEKTLNKAAKAGLELPAAADVPELRGLETTELSPESVVEGADAEAERLVGEHLLGVVARARELGTDPEKALRAAVRGWRGD